MEFYAGPTVKVQDLAGVVQGQTRSVFSKPESLLSRKEAAGSGPIRHPSGEPVSFPSTLADPSGRNALLALNPPRWRPSGVLL